MSTENTNPPAVKPAITEADILGFLVEKQKIVTKATAEARAKAGISEPRLSLYPWSSNPWTISGYNSAWDSIAGDGKTIEQALASFEKKLTQQPTAETLRSQAAALIAKAEKLEKETA